MTILLAFVNLTFGASFLFLLALSFASDTPPSPMLLPLLGLAIFCLLTGSAKTVPDVAICLFIVFFMLGFDSVTDCIFFFFALLTHALDTRYAAYKAAKGPPPPKF